MKDRHQRETDKHEEKPGDQLRHWDKMPDVELMGVQPNLAVGGDIFRDPDKK
jgi:hypothetical protein